PLRSFPVPRPCTFADLACGCRLWASETPRSRRRGRGTLLSHKLLASRAFGLGPEGANPSYPSSPPRHQIQARATILGRGARLPGARLIRGAGAPRAVPARGRTPQPSEYQTYAWSAGGGGRPSFRWASGGPDPRAARGAAPSR